MAAVVSTTTTLALVLALRQAACKAGTAAAAAIADALPALVGQAGQGGADGRAQVRAGGEGARDVAGVRPERKNGKWKWMGTGEL